MVHVANAEGHRKMLAFQPPSQSSLPSSTSPSSSTQSHNTNLSHILINTISKKFGHNEDNFNNCAESPGNTVVLKNNQNASVGPILPTYKSNSLNLSCIIEDEPEPPGMMMSHIRENSNELTQDPNANLSITTTSISTDPNLNASSTSSTTTTTTVISSSSHGNSNESTTVVYTEKVTSSVTKVSGGSKKRNSSGESPTFTPEKVSQSPQAHDSPGPGDGTTPEKSKLQRRDLEGQQQQHKGHVPTAPAPSPPPPCQKVEGNANSPIESSASGGGGPFVSIPTNFPTTIPTEDGGLRESGGESRESPPHSAATQKHGKSINGTKAVCLKRVSFGSSKGSMVETVIFESPQSEERREPKTAATNGISHPEILNAGAAGGGNELDSIDSPTGTGGGSTGGSRPPSRVRVTFFESEKPLAVSSPESDGLDFEISNMTTTSHLQSPLDASTPNNYSRHLSIESSWDNPFRPDGDLSKEADQIVELIKEGKPINDETLRSISPSVNEEMVMHTSNYTNNLMASPPQGGKNGSAANGTEVQRGVVVPPSQTGAVEHVTLKKKKGCCVIQ